MSITLAQAIVHNTKSGSFPGTPQPDSVSAAFGSNTTAGNTIFVVATGSCIVGGAHLFPGTISDTSGNTYSTLYLQNAYYPNGGALCVYVAYNIIGGANTVTLQATAGNVVAGISYSFGISIIELSGVSTTPVLHSSGVISNAGGNSITIPDSTGTSYTSSVLGGSFVAYQSAFGVFDVVAGADIWIAVYVNPGFGLGYQIPVASPATFVYDQVDTYSVSLLTSYIFFRHFPITIFSITCGPPPDGTVGTPYTYDFSTQVAGGTPPFTYAITSGSLPTGLSLDGSTGIVSGTPTTGGVFPFRIQVTDSLAATTFVDCSITVSSNLAIVCDNPPSGTVGVPYSHALVVTGGTPPYTFTIISGSLPPGLTLDSSSGIISGTPVTPGDYTFSVQVTDGVSNTVTCDLLILGVSGKGANIYVLRDHKLTDDDFGQIYPYYVTYFSPTAEQKQQMALGGTQSLLAYLSAFIEGNSYLHIGCTLQVTFYVNMLQNPWALTVTRDLPPNATFSMECGAGSVQGERIAAKFESSPLEGQTDNAFNLQRVIFYFRQGRLPVRGSAS